MKTSQPSDVKPSSIVEIERLGFAFTEVAEYDLSQLDVTRRVQVRDPNNYAPKEAVQRFAIQMSETRFPPIIVTSDGWLVDGNTRVGARLVRSEKFMPAIILDQPWETATEAAKTDMELLAATLNSQAGTSLTAREARLAVERALSRNWLPEQIARAVGVKPSTVSLIRREIKAQKRLESVGLDPNGRFGGTSLRALGGDEVVGLNNEPFKELAQLAADAAFNAKEIRDAARQMRDAGSDVEALKVAAGLRAEMEGRIREKTLTGVGKPPVARQLRQHLGFLTKYISNMPELIERSSDLEVCEKHLATLTQAIETLTAVAKLQAETVESRREQESAA